MSETPIAVFDFDDTLVHGDSMWTFFAMVAGWPKVGLAFLEAVAQFTWLHFLHKDDRAAVDRGTFFKTYMLQRLLAGRHVSEFKEPIARLREWIRWNDAMRNALQEHYAKGHHVVIASGSLTLYLPDLVKDLPHHTLLCTDIDVVDGVTTGIMSRGNCVRVGKAERVAAYMAEHGPYGESWGYGNFPDDVPMMNLMKHRVIV
jgi:phosphatidylglycerophosphatase C